MTVARATGPGTGHGAGVGTWPVAASAAGIGVLLLADLVLGDAYTGVNSPAFVAGATVAAAVLLASRHLLVATLAAASTSVAITWLVIRLDPYSLRPRLGRDALPGMAEAAGLLLLACWALRALPRAQALLASASVAGALFAVVDARQTTRFGGVQAVVAAVGFAVAAGIGLYLRWIEAERRRDLEAARQDERLAIARELHDVVAHYVTGIVVQAQAAQAVWDERPDAARAALGQIESAGAEALGSMRRMVGSLRGSEPGPLAPAAGIDDLRSLAERSGAVGLPVRLRVEHVPDDLPPTLALSVHRLVAEAITNAQRHATDATAVDVRVAAAGDELTVEVVDDGRPAPRSGRANPPGYGLAGMAERAAALGGRFTAGPLDGGGWAVRAALPLRAAR